MAEVTTGSLAQGEQPDTVIVRLGTLDSGLLLMCANAFAKLKLNVDIMDKIYFLFVFLCIVLDNHYPPFAK